MNKENEGNDPTSFTTLGPLLPQGLNARKLMSEAAAAFESGEARDIIVQRFKEKGIDDEVACALVDVMTPGQEIRFSGPQEIGTAWVVGGARVAFDKDPNYAKRERREARRRRQQRIVRALLYGDAVPNPEFGVSEKSASAKAAPGSGAAILPMSSNCACRAAWR
jgi:hypothetical protein